MPKLKTLKDIEESWKPYETKKWENADEELIPYWVCHELRAEAIKWIKDCMKYHAKDEEVGDCIRCGSFMAFFNVDEVDVE